MFQQLAGVAMGLFNGENDRRQLRQQEKLNVMNNEHAKQMGLFNYDLQKRMWDETNYEGQMAHMKKAGINPALLYGMSGGGGATTGSASAQQPSGKAERTDQIGMGLQMGMQAANLELIKAQTEKTKAEAENISTVDRENTQADTTNKKWTAKLQEIENTFKNETYKASVAKLRYETDIALQELHQQRNKAIISENTWSSEIDLIQNQAAQIAVRNSILNNEKKLGDEQINKIVQDVKNSIRALEQKDVELAQGKRRLDQEDKYIIIDEMRNKLIETGIWVNGASQVLGGVVDLLTKPKGYKGTITETFTNGPKGSTSTTTETRPIKK